MAPREAFSAWWAALASSHVARVLTAKRKSQSATEYCASGPGRLTPALLTSPSRPPKRSTARATTWPGASAVPMSPCSAMASAPSAISSLTTPSRPGDDATSTAAIFAGMPRVLSSRASLRHVARPIPLPAPVTSTRMVVSSLLGRAGDFGDPVGEVHLAVVLGRVADLAAGAGQAPEAVGVAADAVDDQEGDAVLVGDVERLHHLDGLLGLVARGEIGAERAVHDLDVAGLDGVEVVVAGGADAPLHDLQLAVVDLTGGEHEAEQLVGRLRPAVPVVGARGHLRRHHVHAAVPHQALVVVGGMVGGAHDDPAHAFLERDAIDVVGHRHVVVLGLELGVAVVLPGIGVHAGRAHEAAVDDGVGAAEGLAIEIPVGFCQIGDHHARHLGAVGGGVAHVRRHDVPALVEGLEHALGHPTAGPGEHDATLGHHLPSTMRCVWVPSPWMPIATTSPLAR